MFGLIFETLETKCANQHGNHLFIDPSHSVLDQTHSNAEFGYAHNLCGLSMSIISHVSLGNCQQYYIHDFRA